MHVFLDTSVLLKDPFFKTDIFSLFYKKFTDDYFKLHISEVVLKELLKNFENDIKEKQTAFSAKAMDLSKILPSDLHIDSIDTRIYVDQLSQSYKNMGQTYGLSILKAPPSILKEAIDRAVNYKKPFARKGGGFKDCIIWLTYKNVVQKYNLKNVHFISNNTHDFFSEDGNSIHDDLKADIPGIAVYKSINEFVDKNKLNLKISENKSIKESIDSWKKNVSKLNRRFKEHNFGALTSHIEEFFERNKPEEFIPSFDDVYWEPEFETEKIIETRILHTSIYDDFAIVKCQMDIKVNGNIYEDPESDEEEERLAHQFEMLFELEFLFELDDSNNISFLKNNYIHLKDLKKKI